MIWKISPNPSFSKRGVIHRKARRTEVLTNIEGVLEVFRMNCLSHPPLTPPIKGGGLYPLEMRALQEIVWVVPPFSKRGEGGFRDDRCGKNS